MRIEQTNPKLLNKHRQLHHSVSICAPNVFFTFSDDDDDDGGSGTDDDVVDDSNRSVFQCQPFGFSRAFTSLLLYVWCWCYCSWCFVYVLKELSPRNNSNTNRISIKQLLPNNIVYSDTFRVFFSCRSGGDTLYQLSKSIHVHYLIEQLTQKKYVLVAHCVVCVPSMMIYNSPCSLLHPYADIRIQNLSFNHFLWYVFSIYAMQRKAVNFNAWQLVSI